jgi:predicted RNA-binding protein associated with RNAse of E/G family
LEVADMLVVKNGARYVVFLLNGKAFSALVVATNFEQDREIKNTN